MRHPSPDDLVLYYYGEPADRALLARHLEACEACRRHYDQLTRMLGAIAAWPVPERNEQYAGRLWARIQPSIAGRQPSPAPLWARAGLSRFLGGRITSGDWRLATARRWGFAASMAALVLAAFVAGRFWPAAPPARGAPTGVAEGPEAQEQVRERILLVAIGDHLERSQMVLVELVNGELSGPVDIASQQASAQDLVAANRLYRLSAESSGDAAVASVLEELERLLVEIANGPATLDAADAAAIRERIDAQGLLFKVRAMGSRVREQELRPGATTTSDNRLPGRST